MRRMIGWVLVVILLLGCGAYRRPLFICTQEPVCTVDIDAESYSFLKYGQDTGMIIPGLCQNFVPQGIAYWSQKNWILISGYFSPVSESIGSAVLAVDLKTGDMTGEYTLSDRQGRAYNGHFSGLAVTETDLYITGHYSLYRIPLREFTRVGCKGTLKVAQQLPVSTAAASCAYTDGVLWVGEHYHARAYPLRGEHVMRSNDGQTYYAWLLGYRITKEGRLKPCAVYSIPDRIQGVTLLNDGRVVLSQSYGRTNASQILICSDPRVGKPDAYVEVEGYTVPLWFLDNANGMRSLEAPPMAEGCCNVNGEVYLIFESGAYYYRAFMPENPALHPTDRIWKLDLINN